MSSSNHAPVPNQNSNYVQPNLLGLVSKLSLYARRRMVRSLLELAQPTPDTTVLDVGVTLDRREDCNFFEKAYPYPGRITAVGLEDASFLEQEFPGLKFVQANALDLPFADQSFDLVVSFAVIEHVGSRAQQRAFVRELCRVGKQVYITTPNRWYPVEFHTILPLIHWLPPDWFRRILRVLGHDFWAKEDNLNLLTLSEFRQLFPPDRTLYYRPTRLLGWVSNLSLFAVRR
ncbi:class I SAM-dependent methyltransferase [Thermoleptolyngbya sp.]